MKQELYKIIENYIDGTASDSEKEFVEKLFAQGETNQYLRNQLEKDWSSFAEGSQHKPDLSYLLERIHQKIRQKELKDSMKPLKKLQRAYFKAAAILLFPLILSAAIIYFILGKQQISKDEQSSVRIFAPMGSRISFNLPDGTKGMLNSGSYLDYSLPFAADRKINLEGEGWFEVAHDPEHPFEITASGSVVRVLGTSFNISAYSVEDYFEIVLNSGKVEYYNIGSTELVALRQSERLVRKGGNTIVSVVNTEKYNAWTEGKLVFRNDPMDEVVRRIERWYNVNITIADKELEKYSFRATFQDDTLDDVLKFLSMTSPIAYEISPRKILSDGTFGKTGITIHKKQ